MKRVDLVQKNIDKLKSVHMGALGDVVRPMLSHAELSLALALLSKRSNRNDYIRSALNKFWTARGMLRFNHYIK